MRTAISILGVFEYALVSLAAIAGTAQLALAQGVEAGIPANAYLPQARSKQRRKS